MPCRSDAAECASANNSNDTELVKRCDGVVAPWQAWYNSKTPAQVAGYVVEYASGLTYATIKGAGHMVSAFHNFQDSWGYA